MTSVFKRFTDLRASFRALRDGGPGSGLALAELAQFCHVDRSCVIVAKDGRVDTHATAVAEGRRETFLKIQQMLALTDAQLLRLRTDDETDP